MLAAIAGECTDFESIRTQTLRAAGMNPTAPVPYHFNIVLSTGAAMPDPTLDIIDLPELPARSPDSHKGDFGRVLVIAGSRGMSGAAVLTGHAALRSGAGLVRIATSTSAQPLVAMGHPCLMTVPLPEDENGCIAYAALETIQASAQESSVLAIGPGLGRSADLDRLVPELLETIDAPIVLDADGLNAFLHDVARLGNHKGQVVITPHPGEFARLSGRSTKEVQGNRREAAEELAQKHQLTVVLKGHQTIVTNGARTYINTTGNPGMATAGSGDVLTGLLAALLGQGFAPFEAAQMAAFLHGQAGDLAGLRIGEVSLIATDLIKYLPRAFREYRAGSADQPF